jgi:GGDEF domain-containing protein
LGAIFGGRYAFCPAKTEEEAFASLDSLPVSLIILTAEKFDFLEKLRTSGKRYSNTPVLIMGKLSPKSMLKADKYGVPDVIKLPFEPVFLDNKVKELLIKFSPPRERPDPVTGLPKKQAGGEMISEVLGEGKKGALMLIELDYYSFASSAVSDDMIITCRDIIQAETAETALLSAAKGGGFLLFVPGLREREKIQKYADELIKKILDKIKKEKIYVSIGLAVSDRHGRGYADLYSACDKGLGEARTHGKNAARFYTW